MQFKTLALQTTYKCNANCDICVFDCDIHKDKKIKLEDAFRYIDEAFTTGSFKEFAISGGEPFLFYDDLVKICTKAHEKNVFISINTNAFWGKNREEAFEMAKTLKQLGVYSLIISADEFHAEYVPYESVRNVIEASKSAGISVEVNTVYTNNSLKMSDIIKNIGDDIMSVQFSQFNCIKCGRAEKKVDENEFMFYNGLPRGKCNGLTTLCIDADNTSYPCCRMTNRNECFKIKNTDKLSINEIVESYKYNIYLKILELYGTGWYIDNIERYKLDVKLKDKYTSICELCGDLFKDVNVYKEAIDELRKKLILY